LLACSNNTWKVIDHMIAKYKMDLTYATFENLNALSVACMCNTRTDVIDNLINKYELHIHIKTDCKDSVLNLACRHNTINIINHLINNYKFDIMDSSVVNNFMEACKFNDDDVVLDLKKEYPDLFDKTVNIVLGYVRNMNIRDFVSDVCKFINLKDATHEPCLLCKSNKIQLYATPCGHGFCLDCIVEQGRGSNGKGYFMSIDDPYCNICHKTIDNNFIPGYEEHRKK
jgi:hypothetical protein